MFDFNVMTNRAGDTVADMFVVDGTVHYSVQFNGDEGVAHSVWREESLGAWVCDSCGCQRWTPGINYNRFTEEELNLN